MLCNSSSSPLSHYMFCWLKKKKKGYLLLRCEMNMPTRFAHSPHIFVTQCVQSLDYTVLGLCLAGDIWHILCSCLFYGVLLCWIYGDSCCVVLEQLFLLLTFMAVYFFLCSYCVQNRCAVRNVDSFFFISFIYLYCYHMPTREFQLQMHWLQFPCLCKNVV